MADQPALTLSLTKVPNFGIECVAPEERVRIRLSHALLGGI